MNSDKRLTLKVFEAYAEVYAAMDEEAVGRFKEAIKGEDKREILKFILAWYAFERQTPVPYFKWKAIELLKDVDLDKSISEDTQKEIWRKFCDDAPMLDKAKTNEEGKIIRPKGDPMVNKKNNPLNPEETDHEKPIWAVDFIANILDKMDSADKIKSAYENLIGIRGINHKIASFILRDLAILGESKYAQSICKGEEATYIYFQPIDTWIRYIATMLKINSESDRKCAYGICKECIDAGVNPLKFNQGAWYVGAKVMRCRSQLRDILEKEDSERAIELTRAGVEKDNLDPYLKRDIIKDEKLKEAFRKAIKKIDNPILNDVLEKGND